ncbi:MAG: LAGLIDADG family homing endonuclease [Candidatus Aenigmatarchaeota archaeon]
MRLENSTKQLLIKKIKENETITKICKDLNLNKSTVYYYIKKLRGRRFPETKIEDSNLENVGELIGVFSGDGYFFFDKKSYKYNIFFYFSKDEEEYVKRFINLLNSIINRYIYVYKYKNVNKIFVRVTSKKLSELIKKYVTWNENQKRSYTIRLVKINFLSNDFLIGFLRGLFDSDGYTYKDKREIDFITVSPVLARQITKILRKVLNIRPLIYVYKDQRENRKKIFYVKIKQYDAEKFLMIIRPNNLKRYPKWFNRLESNKNSNRIEF